MLGARGLGLAATCAALVLATGAPARAQPARARPTVAVLYFDYEGKVEDLVHLRKGLAQMLVSDLSGQPGFDVVERTRLEEVLRELDLNKTRAIDRATANRIGKLLGARYLIIGGLFDFRGTLRIDARVVEVETGKIVKSVGGSRKVDEFLGLEQELAAGLLAHLGAATRTKAAPVRDRALARTNKPRTLPVAVAARYGKALDAVDRGDRKQAQVELQAVVAAQPDFELAAADLARLAQ